METGERPVDHANGQAARLWRGLEPHSRQSSL